MKLTSTLAIKLVTILALAVSLPFMATAAEHSGATVSANASASAALSSGTVKKIVKDSGKITIKHGPLANLDMPGMTMVFRVKDPAMLDQVKAGDKIKFIAEKMNGALTVTTLQLDK